MQACWVSLEPQSAGDDPIFPGAKYGTNLPCEHTQNTLQTCLHLVKRTLLKKNETETKSQNS